MVCSVLLEIKSKSVDKTFDYQIKEEQKEELKIGKRVLVPFGKQKLTGYVLEIKETAEKEIELKEIIEVLDEEVVLTEELLELGKYMKQKTLSSLSSSYSTMLPTALKAKKNNNIKKKYESYLILQIPFEEAIELCKNEIQKEIITLFDTSLTISKKEANSYSVSAVKTLLKNKIIKEEQEETYRYQIGL